MPFRYSSTARSNVPAGFEAGLNTDGPGNGEMMMTTVSVHPLGVKPLGNAYTANGNIRTKAGLFALLPDELITQTMEWLDPLFLLRCGSTCKSLYAFSRQDELWKALCLR